MESTMEQKNIAIACQGGGSHAAFAAGALQTFLPTLEQKRDQFRLVGISGTSGGAICALLAWYGMLQGGSAVANDKLEQFWQSNCAQLLGEQLWNRTVMAGKEPGRQETLYSPYEWPLHQSEVLLTKTWPVIARMLGSLNVWTRAEFFQLDALITAHVDFALIAALGNFCSVPRDIARWLETDIASLMCRRSAPRQEQCRAIKERLEAKIRANAAMPGKLLQMMDALGFDAATPLRRALRDWHAPEVRFDEQSLIHLSAEVTHITRDIPQLLLGAVDVGNGEFTAFSSERGENDAGICLNAVLASAALPWVFEAVKIAREQADGSLEMHQYWDGLFSQNPPIKNFISDLVDDQRKADEIWVLQINPCIHDVETLPKDIWDRRNELAGNLSLNQEIAFIGAINRKLDGGHSLLAQWCKQVQVHRIVMDGAAVAQAAGMKLGSLSKFDRSVLLKNTLLAQGHKQVGKFLAMHDAIADACNDLHSSSYGKPDQMLASSDAVLDALRVMVGEDGDDQVRLVVNETFLSPEYARMQAQVPTPPDATVCWHVQGKTDGGSRVRVEGESDFSVVKDGSMQVRVHEIRIVGVEAIKKTAEAAMAQTVPRPHQVRSKTAKYAGRERRQGVLKGVIG
jgi:predicted acylesterase/phospholipase RssA